MKINELRKQAKALNWKPRVKAMSYANPLRAHGYESKVKFSRMEPDKPASIAKLFELLESIKREGGLFDTEGRRIAL